MKPENVLNEEKEITICDIAINEVVGTVKWDGTNLFVESEREKLEQFKNWLYSSQSANTIVYLKELRAKFEEIFKDEKVVM